MLSDKNLNVYVHNYENKRMGTRLSCMVKYNSTHNV